MGESTKSVLALLMIIGMIGGVLAWMSDGAPWPALAGFPALAIGSLGALLWSLKRKDTYPDFLKRSCGRYFERNGFCFAISPRVVEDQIWFDVYFQNRYERPCRAQVVARPSEGFFLNRRKIEALSVEIECEGAAFGVAHVPWGVPARYQGKTQDFDVLAHVVYPSRRGRMVRYSDGLRVGTANRAWGWGLLSLLGALGGTIVFKKPAKLKLTLPSGVAETVPEGPRIQIATLWRPEDAMGQGETDSKDSVEAVPSPMT